MTKSILDTPPKADHRAYRDPVLYNAAVRDCCTAMQEWLAAGKNFDLLQPLTEAEVVQALVTRLEGLRQPLR